MTRPARRVPAIYIFFLLLFSCLSAEDSAYVWPLDKSPVLTSSFGEVRSNHIHSGIDLSAGGEIGLPIHAVESGQVIRISFSPWGYGKAIYLRLDNGKTAVYAHLDHLIPTFEKIVWEEQKQQGRYRVNMFLDQMEKFKKHPIRVWKGQLLGYSGETGVGYPHLHFEIRSGANDYPLNPLNNGFAIKDDFIPQINNVLIRPFYSGQSGNFSFEPAPWNVSALNAKNYALKDTAWIADNSGLEVGSIDYVSHGGGVACLYKRSLYMDDSLVFSASYDTLPYEVSHFVMLDRDLKAIQSGLGYYETLFREPGSQFPVYGRFQDGEGIVEIAKQRPGLHKIRIEVSDAAGNTAKIFGTLGIGNPPVVKSLKMDRRNNQYQISLSASKGSFSLSRVEIKTSLDGQKFLNAQSCLLKQSESTYTFFSPAKSDSSFFISVQVIDSMNQHSLPLFRVWTTKPQNRFSCQLKTDWNGENLSVIIPVMERSVECPKVKLFLGTKESFEIPIERRTVNEWRGAISLAGHALDSGKIIAAMQGDSLRQRIPIYPFLLTPQKGCWLISHDKTASVDFPSQSALKPQIVELLEVTDIPVSNNPELKIVSRIFSISPPAFFVDHPFEMEVRVADSLKNHPHIGLFTWSGKEWNYEDRIWDDKNSFFKAKSRMLSPFALFMDTVAPKIENISIADKSVLDRPPQTLQFQYSEKGSGISSDLQIRTWIDGEIWINEIDPETKRVKILHSQEIAVGNHVLKIIVKDALANETKKEVRFKIRYQ